MRAVITIRKTEKLTTAERHKQGSAWVYEAVRAYGVSDLDADSCPIERTEKGKPYFPARPEVCFSVSHSGPYWACAVAERPVGLDIQKHKGGRLEEIARRFFHAEETAWLAQQGIEHFYDVWAAKESYVKWTGQGIDRHFDEFSVVADGRLIEAGPTCCFYHARWVQDYSLCLCGEEPWGEVQIVEVICQDGAIGMEEDRIGKESELIGAEEISQEGSAGGNI
ncbi:MAG: 4'-phosphopantetheinyl transferase superfamily protein [Lachnospiraceae bacterium]|nr:4'-phosphopantetheinyl transferase superfamily protein [Lachnospiraceae bacterium]